MEPDELWWWKALFNKKKSPEQAYPNGLINPWYACADNVMLAPINVNCVA